MTGCDLQVSPECCSGRLLWPVQPVKCGSGLKTPVTEAPRQASWGITALHRLHTLQQTQK